MSSEVFFTAGGEARPGPRCRYCARVLVAGTPAEPDEMTRHCVGSACNWCSECANGLTSVAPWQAEKEQA